VNVPELSKSVLQQQAKHELHQCWFCGGAASGTTRLATVGNTAVVSLLRGFWPLSSHGQGPKGVGVSPAVSSARPCHSSGLAVIYEQVSGFLLETQPQTTINTQHLSKD